MDRTRKKSVKRYFDYSLLFVTIFIAGFGLIMIYSTSSYTAQMKFGNQKTAYVYAAGVCCHVYCIQD